MNTYQVPGSVPGTAIRRLDPKGDWGILRHHLQLIGSDSLECCHKLVGSIQLSKAEGCGRLVTSSLGQENSSAGSSE